MSAAAWSAAVAAWMLAFVGVVTALTAVLVLLGLRRLVGRR